MAGRSAQVAVAATAVSIGASLVLAVGGVVRGDLAAAALGAGAATLAVLFLRQQRTPAEPVPAHVDDDWARRVIAASGETSRARQVRALRAAEPRLGPADAAALVDRVR